MGCCHGAAGVFDLRQEHQGSVRLRNDLSVAVSIKVAEPNLLGATVLRTELAPGADFAFEPGVTRHFDFHVTFGDSLRAHVRRGGVYSVADTEGSWVLKTLSLPERARNDQLANVKGLSISFSASGWLVVYQLGTAACLQDHGIASNPYARVSGASGGALTACLMMYGADIRKVVDVLLESAARLHKEPQKAFLLRKFVLQAMQEVIRDGSYQHPLFQEERCEIGVSSNKSEGGFAKMMWSGQEHRLKSFSNSSDLAIALLASSTCGISGLPFKFIDEDGQEQEVADGAFKNFLPRIDENSITVKPFSDGIDVFKLTGKRSDVGPSEYVPMSFGIFPAPVTFLEHLYELGYQDMKAWLQAHFEERAKDFETHQALFDLYSSTSPGGSTCHQLPMLQRWHDVAQRGAAESPREMGRALGRLSPVPWPQDMLNAKNFLSDNATKVLKEGDLEISSFIDRGARQVLDVRRWVVHPGSTSLLSVNELYKT